MDSIFEEKLKKEELLSGFEILNTDDDSFLLDNGTEYPGKLPYKLSASEIKDAEASEKLIKEFLKNQEKEISKTEEEKVTVWNLFEEDDSEFVPARDSSEIEDNEDSKLGHSFDNEADSDEVLDLDPYDNNQNIINETKLSDNSSEYSFSEKIVSDEENNQNHSLNKFEADDPEPTVSDANEEEEIKLDEDFLSLLQGDLNKSLLRKSDSDSQGIQQNAKENEVDFSDFKPVDDLVDSVLIEFDSLGVSKPSEFKEKENKLRSTPTKKLKPISTVEEKKEITRKERKKFKLPAFPWRKIAFAFASVGIFGGIFWLGYYLFFVDPETQDQINKIKTFNLKRKDKQTDILKLVAPKDNPENLIEVTKDSIAVTQNNLGDDINRYDQVKKINLDEKWKIETVSPKKIPFKNRHLQTQKLTKTQKNTNLNTTSFNSNDDRIYVVEVFSTSIREEAEKWLLNLHNQKIYDGVIRTQKVRDDLLYKVRFGNYTSYEQAKLAVLRSGIKKAIIDRIK